MCVCFKATRTYVICTEVFETNTISSVREKKVLYHGCENIRSLSALFEPASTCNVMLCACTLHSLR